MYIYLKLKDTDALLIRQDMYFIEPKYIVTSIQHLLCSPESKVELSWTAKC